MVQLQTQGQTSVRELCFTQGGISGTKINGSKTQLTKQSASPVKITYFHLEHPDSDCRHNAEPFSKFAFLMGKYKEWDLSSLDIAK